MIKKIIILIGLFILLIGDITMTPAKNNDWDKTFPKSNKVDVKKVNFTNRYGIKLVGDLYTPKDQPTKKMSAIAVSGPFGAVKEQASGLYAQTLAEKGFITLAFDPSYTGESSGEPRNVASPDINTEDFCAAVDFLSNQNNINPNKIEDIIRNIKEDTDHGAKTKLSKRFDLYINRKPHCRMWCFIFCIT